MLGKGFGGAERSFVDTALALAGRGHTVQAICHTKFVKQDLLKGVPNLELQQVNAGSQWDFWTPRIIAWYLREFRSEIAHTQLKRAAWHGGRGAQRAGVPVVAKLQIFWLPVVTKRLATSPGGKVLLHSETVKLVSWKA